MYRPGQTFLLLSLQLSLCLGDRLGPTYPPPLDLSSEDSLVPSAWQEVTSVLNSYLDKTIEDPAVATALTGLENVTFSIGAFSLHDPAVSEDLQYHYSSPFTTKSTNGTKKVDANTIYRVASITKLFTVYAALLSLTEEQWYTPLNECVPELAAYLESQPEGALMATPWDEVTPWSLANQISGIARTPVVGDLLASPNLTEPVSTLLNIGLPLNPGFLAALNDSDFTGATALTSALYAKLAAPQPPTYLPWTTPMYTNNGFAMLGVAITNLLGGNLSYNGLIQSTISDPLGLDFTGSVPPTTEADIARSAIANPTYFFTPDGPISFSGGILSTISDLSLLGISILNSTLLSPAQTRQWLHPTSHTASVRHSVGAPWEIFRWTSPLTGKVVDLYTKSGNSGDATSHFILIPDYGFGFSYLSLAPAEVTQRPTVINVILDLIVDSLLPALEAQAAAEAQANFVGTYTTSADSPVNATIKVGWNESTAAGAAPALSLLEYTYNNTDLLSLFLPKDTKPRLLPTILAEECGPTGKVAFEWSANPNVPAGLFQSIYKNNLDWLGTAGVTWSGVSVSSFVFDVDAERKATAVTAEIFEGLQLQRVQE
ncbi:uncharacterized protein AB675_11887 [Cyphellophora attinorum]|uniref:Uncharacterized protein n=1 Tax=Cyphellophora attinorum TaxID=1664694 RepID=A0A0N1NWI5_9EURO|nr:uncharacterized protein AB675_11887 [Phialophora attinorum]KPI36854.1 hypothetical protein AB675_11887 [Phialophora attinorum]